MTSEPTTEAGRALLELLHPLHAMSRRVMADGVAAIEAEARALALPNCGDHPKFGPQPLFLGCGEVIDGLAYRCAQCDTLFHRVCIRQHFGWPEAGGSLMPHALDEGLAALVATPAEQRLLRWLVGQGWIDDEQARDAEFAMLRKDGISPKDALSMIEDRRKIEGAN